MENRIPLREEIAEQDRWAISDLYENDAAWEADYQRAETLTAELAACRGHLGDTAQGLLSYLRRCDALSLLLENLGNYAQRKNDEDTRVAAYQAMSGRFQSLYVRAGTALAFETPEILRINDASLAAFYKEAPELELYRRRLDEIFRAKPHTLSDAEERILASAGEMASAPERVYSLFMNADLHFPDAVDGAGNAHPLNAGTFVAYEMSEDRVLRKSAYDTLYGTLNGYKNSIAAMLNAQVKQLQFFASARGYESALHAALDRTHVPVSVYHSLIGAVHENLGLLHRYARLRKKLLGVDALHFYDIYAQLVKEDVQTIPFAQARETVCAALAPLGDKYGKILRAGFDDRWIDIYQNEGKRSGAYSAGTMVHPFVLLNYNGTLDSQFTLAHEMGHALHSYLSNQNQPYVYHDYVIFVAEVASTCNEALLMEHLLQSTKDRKMRLRLINHFLEQFKSTLYRQTMFAEFELKIAELSAQGTPLTAETLCSVYQKLNALYFGDVIEVDDQIALEWARIPHFYYNYYVFQYATGYAAAIALSRRILQEGEPAVSDYLRFLSGGCSKDPIDLLRGAGVDMTTAEPVKKALQLFEKLLDEMEYLTEETHGTAETEN